MILHLLYAVDTLLHIRINPALYHDIQVILSRLVAKASQLIDNVTTNLAESWMHIRTKFDIHVQCCRMLSRITLDCQKYLSN